jgi:hypothetical protein
MVVYNPAEPPHVQEEDWDCSQESAEWALHSVGRRPSDAWLEQTMLAEGVVSRSLGLLDASGKGLADFLTRHYGEFGFHATNDASTSFDRLAKEAGRYPLMIGARNWGGSGLGHWSGLAAYDTARGVLDLRNPAGGGPRFGPRTLTPDQFAGMGPWSMVRLMHPDLIATSAPNVGDKTARERELETTLAEVTRGGVRDALENILVGDLEDAPAEIRNVLNRLEHIAVEARI